jgi:multidrug efflux pump subunit AcrB
MSDTFDKLKKTFDVPGQTNKFSSLPKGEIEVVSDSTEVTLENTSDSDVYEDYQHIRKHLKSLMRRSNETLDEILDLASESGAPRAYEVAGQILKTSSEISEKLIQLHKNKKELNEVNNNVNVTNNNAMFFGSTNELLKALKSQNIIEDNK